MKKMEKKSMKSDGNGTAVAVVKTGARTRRSASLPTVAEQVAQAIRVQVNVVAGVEVRGNFEKLKLGAMVSEAVRLLKLDGASERGPTAKDGGAKGWWEATCPKTANGEPVIPYQTMMRWKVAAEKLPEILCSHDMANAGIRNEDVRRDYAKTLAALAKDPKALLRNDRAILTSAERVAKGMTMRQMLLCGGDDGARGPGRPKGSGAGGDGDPVRKLSRADEAKFIWNRLLQETAKRSVRDAVPLLGEAETRVAYDTLGDVRALLKRHLEELAGGAR